MSGRQRGGIGRERYHIVDGKLLDDRPHDVAARAFSHLMFEIIKLAEDISRRPAGDAGDRAGAFQAFTVADPALNGLAAIVGQALASFDAANGHVGGEVRAAVAAYVVREIIGQLDNAMSGRLAFTARRGNEKPGGDADLRR